MNGNESQDFANKLHRLDALARVHIGKQGSTGFNRVAQQHVLRDGDLVVFRGAYDDAVLFLTGGVRKALAILLLVLAFGIPPAFARGTTTYLPRSAGHNTGHVRAPAVRAQHVRMPHISAHVRGSVIRGAVFHTRGR